VISAGFAGETLTLADVDTGNIAAPGAVSSAILFWIHIYGVQAGDEEVLRIVAPGGRLLAEKRSPVPGNKAVWLAFAGRKRVTASWSAGVYRGEYTLQRLAEGELRQVLSVAREVAIGQR
jgi:hypothetical protein